MCSIVFIFFLLITVIILTILKRNIYIIINIKSILFIVIDLVASNEPYSVAKTVNFGRSINYTMFSKLLFNVKLVTFLKEHLSITNNLNCCKSEIVNDGIVL